MEKIKTRLRSTNRKLYNTLIFDLPAIISCLNCKDCKTTCYAKKAEYLYKNVYTFRMENFKLSKTKEFENIINKELENTKLKTIRIHSSGDFYSQSYIDKWTRIMKKHKDKQFYAYTKVKQLFKWPRLKNFNLISSYIHGNLNYGTKEYVEELQRKYNTFICPDTKKHRTEKICNKTCFYCMKHDNVAFIKH
jgi:hypothetical protein